MRHLSHLALAQNSWLMQVLICAAQIHRVIRTKFWSELLWFSKRKSGFTRTRFCISRTKSSFWEINFALWGLKQVFWKLVYAFWGLNQFFENQLFATFFLRRKKSPSFSNDFWWITKFFEIFDFEKVSPFKLLFPKFLFLGEMIQFKLLLMER